MKVFKTVKLSRSFWIDIGITIKAERFSRYETVSNSKNSSSDWNCNKSTEDRDQKWILFCCSFILNFSLRHSISNLDFVQGKCSLG